MKWHRYKTRLLILILTVRLQWLRPNICLLETVSLYACTPNFDQWGKQVTAIRFHLPWWIQHPWCLCVSGWVMLGAAEDSRAIWILLARLSEPQNSPRAYAIRTGHSIRLLHISAYPILSNGCSAVKDGKRFMLSIAFVSHQPITWLRSTSVWRP